MPTKKRLLALGLVAVLAIVCGPERSAHAKAAPGASKSARAIDGAIAEMKGIVPSRLSDAQAEAKDRALDRAWVALKKNRAPAIPRLKRELADLRTSGTKDDFFSIDAACLLWELAGVAAAPEIAAALDGVDLSIHFQVIFRTFGAAARTRDPRVLPILWHALATDEKTGKVSFPAHFLTIGWPETLDFMVVPFGPELCAHLPLGPEVPRDPSVAMSMLYLSQVMACADKVASVRRWAHDAEGDVQRHAMLSLSELGSPTDRDWLVSRAASPDAKARFQAAYALYEFGDPATTPALRKLLADPDEEVRMEAISGIFHLIDAAGAKALVARRRDPKASKAEVERIDAMLDKIADGADLAPLKAGDERAWASVISAYWRKRDGYFALQPGDRALSRPDLLRALEQWDRSGRLGADDWTSFIESRHVLSVATPDDIPKLISVRGRLLGRHSDEALEEVQTVDRIVKVLRRRAAGATKPNE